MCGQREEHWPASCLPSLHDVMSQSELIQHAYPVIASPVIGSPLKYSDPTVAFKNAVFLLPMIQSKSM